MDENGPVEERRRRYRGSIFFPLVLIFLGVIFLLSNVGVLAGDVWGNILMLWPLLLIALGLDGIVRRNGFAGPVFLIGLGVVFLLANFGYLAFNVWEFVFRLWPLLLIAIGLDIVIGQRSAAGAVFGLAILLVLLFGAIWLFGGVNFNAGTAVNTEQISQGLKGATAAHLVINPASGALHLDASPAPPGLIQGRVSKSKGEQVTENFSVSGDTANYTLKGTGVGFLYIPPAKGETWSWDLAVNPGVPVDLETSVGAGQMDLDLSELQVTALEAKMGVGQTTVTLPASGNFDASVESAIGQIIIIVPQSASVRIQSDTGLATIHVPQGYSKTGEDVYTSPGYGTAENRINLKVNQAIGDIEVQQR
jgi:lia operon protein LiaF